MTLTANYGINASSITITGIGVSGSDPLLSIAGTTMVVLNNGNVGIGTTVPDAKLRVEGEVKNLVNGTTFYMVPRGAIIMWSGPLSSIPDGWQLCDGTNGTPDLRDRFVYGASRDQDLGLTGGTTSYTLTVDNLPPHTHTISNGGEHSHQITYATCYSYATFGYSSNFGNTSNTVTSTAVDHNHGGATGSTGRGTPIDLRPPFYKLAFLCRL
jgi:microcystin-dependent protein